MPPFTNCWDRRSTAARSRHGSDNRIGLSFTTVSPLCYLDCPQPRLTAYGEVVDKYINQLSDFYDELSVESYVIMPNHIHLLLWIKENRCSIPGGQSGTPVPTNIERSNSTCSRFVSTLKRFCNKEYGKSIWQPRFYDHIIRCQEDYDQHAKYIRENPLNWYYDDLYAK